MAATLTYVQKPAVNQEEHRKRFIERMERKLAYKKSLQRNRRQVVLAKLWRVRQQS